MGLSAPSHEPTTTQMLPWDVVGCPADTLAALEKQVLPPRASLGLSHLLRDGPGAQNLHSSLISEAPDDPGCSPGSCLESVSRACPLEAKSKETSLSGEVESASFGHCLVSMGIRAPCRPGHERHWGLGDHREQFCSASEGSMPPWRV